ncbi:MAG: hypothetical protein ACI84R_000479 [Candidatus Azotimanducaceae bacterium]|jgi:hypothetical protein
MQFFSIARAGVSSLFFIALIGCDDVGSTGQSSFKLQYASARDALEKGQFEQANRRYKRLIPISGSLQPRLRLELAHSYLRSGDFAAAAKEARYLASSQSGEAKAAALSVQGTAEHELGLKALSNGDNAQGKPLLQSADRAMAAVLKSHSSLDPLGSLAGRRASIKVRLRSL